MDRMRDPLSVQIPAESPYGRVVGLLDGFGRSPERQHRQHRSEDLFPGDAMGLADVGEHGRSKPEPAIGQVAGRRPARCALLLAGVSQLPDARELGGRVDRADVGVLVQRVAEAQRGQPAVQRGDHLVDHGFLDQQARSRAAYVALVEEDPVDDALDSLVERSVIEHDVRRLAAELEGEALAGAGHRSVGWPCRPRSSP